ncbi:Protein tyrosine phosphatase domain-containing protein 1, partial [Desmophyllum pertusum]
MKTLASVAQDKDYYLVFDKHVSKSNFVVNDYGVRSLESILDMVKVMSFALKEGKSTVSKLENVVNKVQGNIVSVERKAKKFRDDFTQMDKGVSFLNSEVQELK